MTLREDEEKCPYVVTFTHVVSGFGIKPYAFRFDKHRLKNSDSEYFRDNPFTFRFKKEEDALFFKLKHG